MVWQKSFVKQAIKHKRDIVPIYISGNLSNKYYCFAKTGKVLGIKSNLEMFLLPQELTKQRNAAYKIKSETLFPIKNKIQNLKNTIGLKNKNSYI